MNIYTLMTGTAAEIRQEFSEEVNMAYSRVGGGRRYACDIADDLRASAAGLVTAICRTSARRFRIVEDNGGMQTLVVLPKGVNSWNAAAAGNVEYVHVYQRRGDAWEALAGILGMGDEETVMDAEGNEADEYRENGTLTRLVDEMDDAENEDVLDDGGMESVGGRAFQLLFGGDEYDWRGL